MTGQLRIAALIGVALGSMGCSRQQAEGPASPPVTAPTLASVPIAPPTSAVADASRAVQALEPAAEHRSIPLRHTRPVPGDGYLPPGDLTFAAGAPAGAAHPEGTVFVALRADDSSFHVTEWDLATRVALHDVAIDPDGADLQMLVRGPSVGVLSTFNNGPLGLVQLTDSLQVVATHHKLGHMALYGPNAFASDGSLTVVLANGTPDERGSANDPWGLFAMSFDGAGHRVAMRILLPGPTVAAPMGGNLAVVDDHVYVALVDEKQRLRVMKLTRDLRTERQIPIAVVADDSNLQSRLAEVDGHLVLDVPNQPDLLELSLDLATVAHRPRSTPATDDFPADHCGPALPTASQLLALCDWGKFTYLAWSPLPAPAASVRSP